MLSTMGTGRYGTAKWSHVWANSEEPALLVHGLAVSCNLAAHGPKA